MGRACGGLDRTTSKPDDLQGQVSAELAEGFVRAKSQDGLRSLLADGPDAAFGSLC